MPDLSIQVGRPAGVSAEWANFVFLSCLARWFSKNGQKVDLSFGPKSWVRTLPLRGVVAVNGCTPRNRVPLKRAQSVSLWNASPSSPLPLRLGIYGYAPNVPSCISSGISKPLPTSYTTLYYHHQSFQFFLTFTAAIVVSALLRCRCSGLWAVIFFLRHRRDLWSFILSLHQPFRLPPSGTVHHLALRHFCYFFDQSCFPEFSRVFVLHYVTCRIVLFPKLCLSRPRIYTRRVISEVLSPWVFTSSFSFIFFVGPFVVMARGDISVMPANVPKDMDWVEDVVLLSKSVVDEELLASFREAHAVCSTVAEESKYELVAPTSDERVCYYNLGHPKESHFIYMYECLFSKLGVRLPFTPFEQDVLYECRVAPTQLHPNTWGFMKAFQSVCWYLQLDLSLKAFLYFFHHTRPFSQKNSRWASFRAREGRRIFTLYDESFHDFKNYYFKVRAVEGFRPFFENEQGEYQFRLYWYSGPESPKYDFGDLDKVDQEIVAVSKECCAKALINTKTLLTRSPSYIRTE
ncbi:hypothetical protein PIB30_041569 [Stylosanthes scabra]|uniref:Transposase (putative) gypsy type domain-containing protein n=1 Tax=Stylosanthes scabra TaxID=79078 RepID=A0ABU6RFM5_9FABA|nr:hypothetical protein [Stylosanthes scabra]